MGLIPDYENDIFISYAHKDNSMQQDDKRNWVSLLEDYLRQRARGRGYELGIFRDAQLKPFSGFDEQLARSIARSALLLCVISPNYAKSTWCVWELEQMLQSDRRDCIIRLGKYPLDESVLTDQQRKQLRQIEALIETRFYDINESTKLVEDLQPELFPDHLTEFYKRINPVVDHIILRLKEFVAARSNPTPETSVSEAAQQPVVYLAETTRDLRGEREAVRAELVQLGYRVLPEQPLPRESEELEQTVRETLQGAKLSIHLLGAKYGGSPEGDRRSIPHNQHVLAEQSGVPRIIWSPKEIIGEEDEQRKFLDQLKKDATDYLQTPLADLQTIIRQKLQPPASSLWSDEGDAGSESAPINVCLLCHEQDQPLVAPLYSYLRYEEGFNVDLSLQNARLPVEHQRLLQESDGVLLFYGGAEESWIVRKWNLVRRNLATIKDRQPIRAIFVSHPPTLEKRLLTLSDPMVLKHYEDFSADAIAPFVRQIRAAKGGA